MSKIVSRKALAELVERWEAGEIDERAVHAEAEALWSLEKEWPEFPEADPRSIGLEILSGLELLPNQLITPADAPAILEFLATPEGDEASAWTKWKEYWQSLDMDQRQEELSSNPYYSTLPVD